MVPLNLNLNATATGRADATSGTTNTSFGTAAPWILNMGGSGPAKFAANQAAAAGMPASGVPTSLDQPAGGVPLWMWVAIAGAILWSLKS